MGKRGWKNWKVLNIKLPGATRNMQDRGFNVTKDGPKDDFPQYVIKIVSESPTTTAALKRRVDFVTGKSVVGGDTLVNPGEDEYKQIPLQELHNSVVADFVMLKRFAVKIIPGRDGRTMNLYHVPVEFLRYEIHEEGNVQFVVYNPTRGTSDENKKYNKYYPLFTTWDNMGEEIEALGTKYKQEYSGHIFFYNETTATNRVYSRPDYLSAEPWMIADARIGEFHQRNTENNFFLGGIIELSGDPYEIIMDEEGNELGTREELFSKEMVDIHAGTEGTGSFLVHWNNNPDGTSGIAINPWPGTTHDGAVFKETLESARDVICTTMGVPQILLPVSTPGKLGMSTEIRNAIDMLNSITESDRVKLEKCYQLLLQDENIKINPIRSILDLPRYIFAILPDETKTEIIREEYGLEVEGQLLPMPSNREVAEDA